ncbi:hypothetical protein [Winogradskyella sp. UBA3174]|uniref:hypothetical protein n=1 Tax=Winogradskyella sp. UBA3174 TaxID=1947785 RepID=UPI0025EC7B5E|nr:hypothetical protein [Winogradskyella sp. UBA3174]|tara:strand:+ start:85276 stop:86001 length:726 start_codon:yes stop_codon:yes gene_type:complete
MKLSKEEIQFIDNYLIKNEVKYWDVRLELLDHIVSAVEDKIVNNGISFNEALLEVHRGFGNQFIEFGVAKSDVFEKGLYQSNIGFKKFIRQKQKEVGRKYRKITWKHLKIKFTNIQFLIEYIAFVLLFISIYKFSPKSSFLIGLLVLILPNIYSVYYFFKDKSARKSLSFSMATGSAMFLWSMYNLSFYILKESYESVANIPYIIFVLVTCLFYPLVSVNIEVYRKVYKENKKIYNLKFYK